MTKILAGTAWLSGLIVAQIDPLESIGELVGGSILIGAVVLAYRLTRRDLDDRYRRSQDELEQLRADRDHWRRLYDEAIRRWREDDDA